jgi:hypothetical protein
VSGASAISATGTLTRVFPTGGTTGSYTANLALTALQGSGHDLPLGQATFTLPDSGGGSFDLLLGNDPNKGLQVSAFGQTAGIAGTVHGTFSGSTFNINSTVTITVPGYGPLAGSIKADNMGIAACAVTPDSTKVGFEYVFQTGALHVFDTKKCTEKGF